MLRLFRRSSAPDGEADEVAPRMFDVGDSRRVYAIGDIHGCYALFCRLIEAIIEDSTSRGPVDDFRIVLLGDLIDRGPDSRDVIDLAIALGETWPGAVCLMGNHEEVFDRALTGDEPALRFFRDIGAETLISYGMDEDLVHDGEIEDLYEAMIAHVPLAHREFITGLPNSLVIGDYLFVHAGIRPGVPLDAQMAEEMRWIRAEFLESRVEHPLMVVHGHSITDGADERGNRIGIDTGAYLSGRLTAIGLQGTDRWFLST